MTSQRIVVVGGGAAGFFAAITCAQARPDARVSILEAGPDFLAKVRISGGGRCNVTHACFDPQILAGHYPRGERILRGAFRLFQPGDTIDWFESRGVKLVTQEDGCLFPATNSSQTVIDCFLREARNAGVILRNRCHVEQVRRMEDGFELVLAGGERMTCDRLLLATGGCRTAEGGALAVSLGHAIEPPVPSLFTFNVGAGWLRALAGVVVEVVEASVPGSGLRERDTLLLTHWGVSGPVILRISAWGARVLRERQYQFPLLVNWMPHLTPEAITAQLQAARNAQPARLVVNSPLPPLTARLWEQLVLASGIPRPTRWSDLSRQAQHNLVGQLIRTELPVTGKSTNKEEFVTCGGVKLGEVDFKTMESRLCPGLHFAGELLDIDGLTGGFNFQAAWTTGWIAGLAMAGVDAAGSR